MRAAAALLCACACVGALQIDEPSSSVLQFWALSGAHSLRRRDAPIVPADKPATTAGNSTNGNNTDSSPSPLPAGNSTVLAGDAQDSGKKMDLSKPGVLKRGLLVFGGFGLLALAYFMFYKRRRNRNKGDGTNHPSDGMPFRYGVLQTDERSERVQLTRMPLTMDSDDDDEEDLEIFDLGLKSTYRNPPSDDSEAVREILASSAGSRDSEHLLLDIEDRSVPAVIPVSSTRGADVI